jgi:hypothetical protein
MKSSHLLFAVLASLELGSALAATHHQLKFEITADTQALCEMASDQALDQIESKLNDQSATPIFIKSVTVCSKTLLGDYRKVVTLRQARE